MRRSISPPDTANDTQGVVVSPAGGDRDSGIPRMHVAVHTGKLDRMAGKPPLVPTRDDAVGAPESAIPPALRFQPVTHRGDDSRSRAWRHDQRFMESTSR